MAIFPTTVKSAIASEAERLRLSPDVLRRLLSAVDEATQHIEAYRNNSQGTYSCEAERRDQIEAAWGG
jgi:hypothetical protein